MTLNNQVTNHIQKLDPSIYEAVEALRQIILGADKEIGEQIKWNSPAFYYTGPMAPFDPKEYKRNIVVMNLHKNRIMLVFPTGSTINDESGLLSGDFKDGRRVAIFKDLEDVIQKSKSLASVIRNWLQQLEK